VEREIIDTIMEMAHKYDSKLLGICLLVKGGQLLKNVHSAGLCPVEEVRSVANLVVADMLEPLAFEEVPQVGVIGKPNKLS
jgi:hypothetical protein